MSNVLMIKKLNDGKGWRPANDQFWANQDRLLVDYEDDELAGLTDVSSQYEWKIEAKND